MTEFSKCDLRTMCEKKWEELTETDNDLIRYCGDCEKNVFALRTREELGIASAVGRCVALAKDNNVFGWVGQPEGEWDWMEEETETIRVRFVGPVSAGVTKQFRNSFPRTFAANVDWNPEQWTAIGKYTPYVAKNIVDELNVRYPGIVVEVQNG
jgi:hypothetical protein